MNCQYLHQKVSKKACKFFKQGNCPNGDNCKFAHDPISEPLSQNQTQQDKQDSQPSTLNANAPPFQPSSTLSEAEQKKLKVLESLKQRKQQQDQQRKNSSPEKVKEAIEQKKEILSMNKYTSPEQVKELLQKKKEEQLKQKQEQKQQKQQKYQQKPPPAAPRQVTKVAGEAPTQVFQVEPPASSQPSTRMVISANNQTTEPAPQVLLGKRNEKEEAVILDEEIKEEESNKRRKLEDQQSQTLFKSLEDKDLEMKDQSAQEQIQFKEIKPETQIQEIKLKEGIGEQFRALQEEFNQFAKDNEKNLQLDETSGMDRDMDRLSEICNLSKDMFGNQEFNQEGGNKKLFLFIELNQLPAKYNTQIGKKSNKPPQPPPSTQVIMPPKPLTEVALKAKEEQIQPIVEVQKSPVPSAIEEPPKVIEPSQEQRKMIQAFNEPQKPLVEQEENKESLQKVSSQPSIQNDIEMKDQVADISQSQQENVEQNQAQTEQLELVGQKAAELMEAQESNEPEKQVQEQPKESVQEIPQQQSNISQSVQEEEEKKEPITSAEQSQYVQQPVSQVSQPASQVQKKKITMAEIEQEIKEFNALMDQICTMLDFQPVAHKEDPDLENLISFGTRVELISEYFDKKAPEVVQEIKNLLN